MYRYLSSRPHKGENEHQAVTVHDGCGDALVDGARRGFPGQVALMSVELQPVGEVLSLLPRPAGWFPWPGTQCPPPGWMTLSAKQRTLQFLIFCWKLMQARRSSSFLSNTCALASRQARPGSRVHKAVSWPFPYPDERLVVILSLSNVIHKKYNYYL